MSDPTTFENRLDPILCELRTLLLNKHQDYGSDNLNTWGVLGIAVRISDKEARLRNLLQHQSEPKCETLRDTGLDLAGYGLRLVMQLDSQNARDSSTT